MTVSGGEAPSGMRGTDQPPASSHLAEAATLAQEAELRRAYAFCRDVARREAKNFFYAFRVLPAAKSDAMCAVYAFMRKADDLADDESMPLAERRLAMAAWTDAWRRSRDRPPTGSDLNDPVFLAVRDTQSRFGIPDLLFEELIAGTTLDLQPLPEGVFTLQGTALGPDLQVYETEAALRHYCYLVASVVGLVCIRIFGYTDPAAEQYAVDTGIAFQLTNILRDLREDAERGRLYLSADVLAEYHLRPEAMIGAIARRHADTPVLLTMRHFEREAQRLYGSVERLVPLLAPDARGAMRVLARIYHRLLDRIAEDPGAVLRGRVSVSTAEKLAILAEGGVAALETSFPA